MDCARDCAGCAEDTCRCLKRHQQQQALCQEQLALPDATASSSGPALAVMRPACVACGIAVAAAFCTPDCCFVVFAGYSSVPSHWLPAE
jgi:hypothetical protein